MPNNEQLFKAKIVQMILMGNAEGALKALSEFYKVGTPHLKVGMPKKHSKNIGCYVSKTKTIHVKDREKLCDPFVILHEFYHHLRTQHGKHKGTEKYANKFAMDYIKAFRDSRKHFYK